MYGMVKCSKEDWPFEFSQDEKNDLIRIETIIQGNEKSNEISLRRTLKKSNLCSIEPTKLQGDELALANEVSRHSVFVLNVRKGSIQNLLSRIQNNWTEIDNSKLVVFQIADDYTLYRFK